MVIIYTAHAIMQTAHPVMLLMRLKLIIYFGYRLANINMFGVCCLEFAVFYIFFTAPTFLLCCRRGGGASKKS